MELRKLGKTGMKVTPLCVGTSALGNFPAQYGYEVNADQAIATLRLLWMAPSILSTHLTNMGTAAIASVVSVRRSRKPVGCRRATCSLRK